MSDLKQNAGGIVLGLIMLVVLLMGVSAVLSGLNLLINIGTSYMAGAFVAVAMGGIFTGLAGFYFYFALVAGPRAEARAERRRRLSPGQPWLEREDWAARRIVHTTGGVAGGLWFWSAGWCGILSFLGWVNYDKIVLALSESWWNVALLAVFAGAGLIGLSLAIRSTIDWLRYGTSVLHLATLPAQPGERFKGTLEARLQPLPKRPLRVELVCEEVRWVTTGYGKNRTTRLDVRPAGSTTCDVDAGQFYRAGKGARGAIEIVVPNGLPDSGVDEQGNGVRWILCIATSGDDAPFSCSFEVPVYSRG